ncbi:MAG: hypothetical protein H6621_04525 [Halobacteriovoraceae bacterium]|nr:hypothetical protein [Halobacteriovoraceae bacterium]
MKVLFKIIKFVHDSVVTTRNHYLKFKYKTLGAHVGKGIRFFGTHSIGGDFHNLTLEDHCVLNEDVIINCKDKVVIGSYAIISARVQIQSGKLKLDVLPRGEHNHAPITIGRHSWVAAGVVIAPGVTIGEGSVIGANSVVLENTEPWTLYAGSPAKKIKQLPIPKESNG